MGGGKLSEAPLALDVSRPLVHQRFLAPTQKGSEARVVGVDFISTFGSSTTANFLGALTLNPRNSTVFPRLSSIASVWCRYSFKKLRFHVFGISAATQRGYTAASSFVNDDLGTVPSVTTEAQILNLENVAVGRPWSYVYHDVNLGALGLDWYTCDTTDSVSPNGEAIGSLILGAATTTAANDILFQLYVEYDVEFCVRTASTSITASPESQFSVVRVQDPKLRR